MSIGRRARQWASPERCVAIACGFFVGLVVLVLRWYVRDGAQPLFWNDSADYVAAAKLSLLSPERLLGIRPVFMPLVLGVLDGNQQQLTIVHSVFSAISWGLLGAVLTVSLRTWPARAVAIGGVITIASVWTVSMWDQQILTESLALSSLALVVSAALWFANSPSLLRSCFLAGSALLWLLNRDSHAIPIAAGALVVGITVWVAKTTNRRLIALTCAYLVAFAFVISASASTSNRNLQPLEHVFAVRVLPYPDRVQWFTDQGMPLGSELLAIPEATDPVKDLAGFTPVPPEPKWEPWRDWLETHGQVTLFKYMATHPTYLWTETQQVPERVFNNGTGLTTYWPLQQRSIPVIDELGTISTTATILIASAALVVIAYLDEHRRRSAIVAMVVIATALPHGVAVWHLDGMESARHMLIASIQLRIGTMILVATAVDSLFALRGTGRFQLARSNDLQMAPHPRE